MSVLSSNNSRSVYDPELIAIAEYVLKDDLIFSDLAYETAYYAFIDSIGCALMALEHAACARVLGPVVPGTRVPNGVKIPGTAFELDPIQAAFNLGTMIRWLDFNDTWLAAEWGHPSDNLGGILAVADYLSRQGKEIYLKNVFTAMIKAYEIQGILALENSFNRVGLDHVVLVKVATTAVVTKLLGGNKTQILAALSNAWIDGQSLRTYRHAPNTGSRKSWAAGDATSRGVWLAWMAMRGEMGYPSALSAKQWGFYDVLFKSKSFSIPREYNNYVMENILFKIAYPAEFHAQTAIEAAILLYPKIYNQCEKIDKIILTTHESAIRIISKTGPLYNAADRDHCLQYMVAIGLLFGELTAAHYEESTAKDPRIDELRAKMIIEEDRQFTRDYLDPEKRSIANAITIYFKDGSKTDKIQIDYPLGHKQRRKEGMPLLIRKFKNALENTFSEEKIKELETYCLNQTKLEKLKVHEFMDMMTKANH